MTRWSLISLWHVIKLCATANLIAIMQASNTGLTGGSTPHGENYDRDIISSSTMRLKVVRLMPDGTQVVCKPGATLYKLEDALRPPSIIRLLRMCLRRDGSGRP